MRMDDYQKWLDTQFLDENVTAQKETEISESADSGTDIPFVPSFLSEPPPACAAEPSQPRYTEPTPPQISQASSARAPSQDDETEIPALDQYIPFLRARSEPTPPEPEPSAASLEQESEPAAIVIEVEPPIRKALDIEPVPVGAVSTAESSHAAVEKSHEPSISRSNRTTVAAEPAPPMPSVRLWNLVPKHLQVLLAMESDDVTQNSYKRQFKESRIELVGRLLDPTLSLEDTARLLSVCPTTVRRYTNKGALTHQRTQGDQRRFKLSDVLAFLEAQSKKET